MERSPRLSATWRPAEWHVKRCISNGLACYLLCTVVLLLCERGLTHSGLAHDCRVCLRG